MTKVTEAHTEARRHSILHSAQLVFAKKGMQVATMAEIASEAGLSAGAIYRYYPSKEALALDCMQHSAGTVTGHWKKMVEGASDPLAGFFAIAVDSFEEMKGEGAGDVTRLMVESILDATRSNDPASLAAARHERASIVAGLEESVGAAIEAGQLPAELEAGPLAEALLSFYMGARLARLLDSANDTDAQLRQVQILIERARTDSETR